VAIGILRWISRDASRRYVGSLAFAVGFLAAFASLETQSLRPTTYWHWLPWLAVAAAIVGSIGLAAGIRRWQRLAQYLGLCLAAAWFLVPTWDALQPYRGAYIAAFTSTLFLLWLLLDPLAERVPRALLCGTLALSSLNGGVLVAAFISGRIGMLGIAAAAAVGGVCFVAIFHHEAAIVRGLLPAHVVILGGVLLAAQLSAGLPTSALVLIAIAPLALWLCEMGPLARLRGRWKSVIQIGVVCLPLAAAWALALSAQQPTEQGW
jgi:hypothetical protein